MTPREIAQQLASDVEQYCRRLLPSGKRQGTEWCCGSIDGDAGDSLRIKLSGPKAGLWTDFARADKGGDLLDLYAAVKRVSIREAIQWGKSELGISDPLPQKKTYRTPTKPPCKKPHSDLLEWLTETRGLSLAAVDAYKLGQHGEEVVFPYLRDGELVFVKYLTKAKKFRAEADCEPCLFGWQVIPPDAREVLICEGEFDALSWWQMGYPALSVPNGANGLTWIENDFERLDQFDVIYLSLDNDKAGRDGTAKIIDRLGRDRCKVITLPVKDGNDALLARLDVSSFVKNARTLDPEELKISTEYCEKVVDIFSGKKIEDAGFYLPWKKLGGRVKLRPGEVSILAGVNGHGKSEAAGHMVLGSLKQGQRVCVASMEFRPERWLTRITRQAAGRHDPSEGYIRKIMNDFFADMWVFDVVGNAKSDRLIEVFEYARRRYGISYFVIDNLAKCGFREDDYSGQKEFVDKLTDFSKKHNVHVTLVAHLRKTENDLKPSNKMDIKGSGGITDMADTVLIWWRNRKKESEIKALEMSGEPIPQSMLEKYDALMVCEKQRNGEDEPVLTLWFDKSSHQFLNSHTDKPIRYVEYSEIHERTGESSIP